MLARLEPVPPMSNNERQRRFQNAHPGYDRRRKARERALAKRVGAQALEARRAAAAAAAVVARATQTTSIESFAATSPVATLVASLVSPPARLCLPAPVVHPMM